MYELAYNKICSAHSTGQIQDNLKVKTKHYGDVHIVYIGQENEIHFQPQRFSQQLKKKKHLVQLDDKDYNEDGVNGVGADEAGQEGHESSIFTIAFSPSGKLLVTGGQDGFCRSLLLQQEC